MPNQKQPIRLIETKQKKHLTKAEIKQREESEVQPITDGISPPAYLSAKQKKRFVIIAGQLKRLNVMGETDCELLGRYIVAEDAYEAETKTLRNYYKEPPVKKDYDDLGGYLDAMCTWDGLVESASKRQDRYFKQAQTAANALGLTITSRCKLVVPKAAESPAANKFGRFAK